MDTKYTSNYSSLQIPSLTSTYAVIITTRRPVLHNLPTPKPEQSTGDINANLENIIEQISFSNNIAWQQEFHNHLLNADVNYQAVHQESSVTTIYISDYFTITIGIKIVIHIDINISIPYQSKDFETGMSTTEYPLNRRCCWRHHYSLNKTLHQQYF